MPGFFDGLVDVVRELRAWSDQGLETAERRVNLEKAGLNALYVAVIETQKLVASLNRGTRNNNDISQQVLVSNLWGEVSRISGCLNQELIEVGNFKSQRWLNPNEVTIAEVKQAKASLNMLKKVVSDKMKELYQ